MADRHRKIPRYRAAGRVKCWTDNGDGLQVPIGLEDATFDDMISKLKTGKYLREHPELLEEDK